MLDEVVPIFSISPYIYTSKANGGWMEDFKPLTGHPTFTEEAWKGGRYIPPSIFLFLFRLSFFPATELSGVYTAQFHRSDTLRATGLAIPWRAEM